MVLYYNLKGSERKPLVKAIEEITGVKSKYLSTRTGTHFLERLSAGSVDRLSKEETTTSQVEIT